MRYPLRLPAILLASAVALLSGCSSGGDNADAQVRLLNASPGYQALDLYVTEEDSDTDALQSSNIGFGALGEYTNVASGTYDVKFKRAGVTSTLATATPQLADDSHVTYVAYGALGRFNYFSINEDVEEPEDDGRSTLQPNNAAEGLTLDIYVTEPDVPLEDASPMFSQATGITTTASGTFRLRVTDLNDPSDVRLDVPSITLEENQVASLILTETTGGGLVDALLLPQQGSLTTFKNTKARVRGAVGLLPGSTATLRVGTTLILNNQPVGVIGNYAAVEAGNVSVTLGVSGSTIPVDNQTLTAGGDYTLLLWNDASGIHATLIADNNHLPTDDDGDSKVRLLNAWSTQSNPTHFAVAYSPVVDATPVGQASAYAEVDSGDDFRIDVYNSTTGVGVHDREVDLEGGSVYTLLVFSDPSGNATTAFRRDDG